MKFSTAVFAVTLLASSAFAIPAAEPAAEPGLTRGKAGNYGYWCIAPGQMCYKNKRDLDSAKADILAGYEATLPEQIAKREANPEPLKRGKAGNYGYWCIAPGQMCYKNKRDLDAAKTAIGNGDYAPLPHEFE